MEDMRVYYHPSVGDYASYPSFELDYALAGAGIGGLAAGAGSYALRKADGGSLLWGLAGALVGGAAGGALVPKKILSWFNPPPFDAPLRYPRQIPKVVVPSFIGESGQVLNFLCHHGAGDVAKDYSGLGNHGKIYGACLTGDSLIYTPEEPIPISEVKIGQKVFSYDQSVVEKTVFDKINRGEKAVYKVKTANREIYATLNHPFLVATWGGQRQANGYNFQKKHPFCYKENVCFLEWKPLEAIKEGDLIAVLHNLPNQEKETEFSEDFMRLIGCFLGDGYVLIRRDEKEGRIVLCLTKQTEQRKYCEILDRLGIRYITNPKGILIYNKKLALKFKELELAHSVKDKYIPSWVWKLPKRCIKALIEGLVDADGWIIKQTPNSYVFQITLSNYELIRQTRALCHYIGLRTSNIYYRKREGHMLGGRMLPPSDEWSFQIYPYDERHKQPRITVNHSMRRMNIILPDELEFQRVSQIEFAGEREVWDVAIPETHNFIAEGIVVHNSWIDGPFGWALGFDGVDDIVEALNSPSLQVLDATFEAWIYVLSLPPNHGTFLAKWHWAEGGFEVLSNGYLRFDHGNITSCEVAVVSTFPIVLNRWYHTAVTRDTSTKTVKLYINGILNNTGIYTLTVAKSDMPVWLGWRPDKVWEHFHGFIALPRIYNRPLTDAELKHHFESTRAIFGV